MKIFKSAFAAGVLIGLSAAIYQSCDNKIIGAFLFSIGLLTICHCKLHLFTGKVGSSNDIALLCDVITGNACGVLFMRGLWMLNGHIFILAVFCGMLMQIAVTVYEKMPYVTIMCVGAFILSGFIHSVAIIFTMMDWSQWL